MQGNVLLAGLLEDVTSGPAGGELSSNGNTWQVVSLGTSNTWSFAWQSNEVQNAQYTLQMRGIDQAGNIGDPASITLVIECLRASGSRIAKRMAFMPRNHHRCRSLANSVENSAGFIRRSLQQMRQLADWTVKSGGILADMRPCGGDRGESCKRHLRTPKTASFGEHAEFWRYQLCNAQCRDSRSKTYRNWGVLDVGGSKVSIRRYILTSVAPTVNRSLVGR